MKNNAVVTGVVIAVFFAGVGFFGGMKYETGQTSAQGAFATRGGNFAGGAGGARGARGGGAGAVFGTIISRDANGITVQLGGAGATSTNGTATGSKIVLVNDSTQISKMTPGSASDLTVGESVIANGSANADGSVTAAMIQIRQATGR